MARAFCKYNGMDFWAKKFKDVITLFSFVKLEGFDECPDRYGRKLWTKEIACKECEDYYEESFFIGNNGNEAELSLTNSGDWFAETNNECVAKVYKMSLIDRNLWGKWISFHEMNDNAIYVKKAHVLTLQNDITEFSIWDFLQYIDTKYAWVYKSHLAYKGLLEEILCKEFNQTKSKAEKIFEKNAAFNDIFDEFLFLCKNKKLRNTNEVVIEGYTAINYLSFLRRNPEQALKTLKAGLPRK